MGMFGQYGKKKPVQNALFRYGQPAADKLQTGFAKLGGQPQDSMQYVSTTVKPAGVPQFQSRSSSIDRGVAPGTVPNPEFDSYEKSAAAGRRAYLERQEKPVSPPQVTPISSPIPPATQAEVMANGGFPPVDEQGFNREVQLGAPKPPPVPNATRLTPPQLVLPTLPPPPQGWKDLYADAKAQGTVDYEKRYAGWDAARRRAQRLNGDTREADRTGTGMSDSLFSQDHKAPTTAIGQSRFGGAMVMPSPTNGMASFVKAGPGDMSPEANARFEAAKARVLAARAPGVPPVPAVAQGQEQQSQPSITSEQAAAMVKDPAALKSFTQRIISGNGMGDADYQMASQMAEQLRNSGDPTAKEFVAEVDLLNGGSGYESVDGTSPTSTASPIFPTPSRPASAAVAPVGVPLAPGRGPSPDSPEMRNYKIGYMDTLRNYRANRAGAAPVAPPPPPGTPPAGPVASAPGIAPPPVPGQPASNIRISPERYARAQQRANDRRERIAMRNAPPNPMLGMMAQNPEMALGMADINMRGQLGQANLMAQFQQHQQDAANRTAEQQAQMDFRAKMAGFENDAAKRDAEFKTAMLGLETKKLDKEPEAMTKREQAVAAAIAAGEDGVSAGQTWDTATGVPGAEPAGNYKLTTRDRAEMVGMDHPTMQKFLISKGITDPEKRTAIMQEFFPYQPGMTDSQVGYGVGELAAEMGGWGPYGWYSKIREAVQPNFKSATTRFLQDRENRKRRAKAAAKPNGAQ